jgi:hypothetical protein
MKGTDYGFRVDASDFIAKMELFHARAKEAAAMAVFEEATDIMEKPNGARDQAPVDTSALRESGKVLEPVITGSSVSVTIGFGDSAIPYAHRQHEELEWRHPKHGKAKYLEDPINEAMPGFLDRIAARVRAILGL